MAHYDVIILGGGIIGTSCAYELSKENLRILLLEKQFLASGASGNSAAMLEAQLEAHRGEPFSSLAFKSQHMFPSLYEEIQNETGLDFEFEQKGIVQVSLSHKDTSHLHHEVLRQKDLGLKAEWIEGQELKTLYPYLGPLIQGAAFYQEDGQVNGRKFTEAMLSAAEKCGTTFIEGIENTTILPSETLVHVDTPKGTFSSEKLIVATGAWSPMVLNSFHNKLDCKPMRGQLLVFDTPLPPIPWPLYTTEMGYVTPKRGFTLAGSTMEDVGFDESTTDAAEAKLLKQTQTLVPHLIQYPILKASAGLRPTSYDGLPFLGALEENPNIIIATGHHRHGILLAPITAQLITELLLSKPLSHPIEPFSPGRSLRPTATS